RGGGGGRVEGRWEGGGGGGRGGGGSGGGLPNEESIFAECASEPLALRPITTMISTSSAPAARTAPTACQLGPPAHGDSCLGPMYAMTKRNITITAPA